MERLIGISQNKTGTIASIHLSVVSHGQASLVQILLNDIQHLQSKLLLHVTLTLNIKEDLPFDISDFSFPIHIIENKKIKGFSANHNASFWQGIRNYPCRYFCVINPDIKLPNNIFEILADCLSNNRSIGLIAPSVKNALGRSEESARCLPTPLGILMKIFNVSRSADYSVSRDCLFPDWVAGMFMLFPSVVFEKIGGFDERYFLYYEDVDLCCRLGLAGYKIALNPDAVIVHDARRQSHRNLRYFIWHITSMLRFFSSPVYRSCLNSKRSQEYDKNSS